MNRPDESASLAKKRIQQTIKKVSKNAYTVTNVNSDEIEKKNRLAIDLMMRGEPDKALELFSEALRDSGGDSDLTAQCLINIGDLVRRINGDLAMALVIFNQAGQLAASNITKSRLKSMEAMVYSYRTNCGEHDPEGMQKSIEILFQAIDLAKQAYKSEDPQKALRAESFALHRLTGNVCNWGTDEQKIKAVKMIDDFLPRLDPDSGEVARLNYAKASVIKRDNPELAGRLLIESALRMLHESPLDSFGYFYRAADCYLLLHKRSVAEVCIERAEKLYPKVLTHQNSGSEIKAFRAVRKRLKNSP